MKTGVASGSTLLVAANAMRLGTSARTPFSLWQLANEQANGHDESRRTLFRHASIHAGLLRTRRGTPYRRCAMCKESLA